MRVGFFTAYGIGGGIEESCRILRKELEDLGVEVYVFTPNITNSNLNPSLLSDVHIIEYRDSWKENLDENHPLIKKILSLNLDVYHVHDLNSNKENIIKSIRAIKNIKVVFTLHYCIYKLYLCQNKRYNNHRFIDKPTSRKICKNLESRYRLSNKFYKPNGKLFDLGISISQATDIEMQYIIPDKPFRRVPTMIDTTRFSNPDSNIVAQIKDKYDLHNKTVIVTQQRISNEKRVPLLIKAFSKVTNPNNKLLVIGDGNDMNMCKKVVKRYKLEDKVVFVGRVHNQELHNYLAVADFAAYRGVYETQGLVFYESLAAGLPVLTFYQLALEGILIDGYNGYSFKTDEEFVEKLNMLIDNKEHLDYLKSNTRKSVEKFDVSNFGKEMLKVYEEVIKL